jgi:hypothetical protein
MQQAIAYNLYSPLRISVFLSYVPLNVAKKLLVFQ